MNFIAIRLIVLACVFGGALFGMFLRGVLPEQHLSADSKDTMRLGTGRIGTMTALLLGLLVASAKSFYDTFGLKTAGNIPKWNRRPPGAKFYSSAHYRFRVRSS
jgi:hypothetical protein